MSKKLTCCICLGNHGHRDCPTGAPEMPKPVRSHMAGLEPNKDGALRRRKGLPEHMKVRLIRGQGIKRGQ